MIIMITIMILIYSCYFFLIFVIFNYSVSRSEKMAEEQNFFQKMKTRMEDVQLDGEGSVPTAKFIEASKELVAIFGMDFLQFLSKFFCLLSFWSFFLFQLDFGWIFPSRIWVFCYPGPFEAPLRCSSFCHTVTVRAGSHWSQKVANIESKNQAKIALVGSEGHLCPGDGPSSSSGDLVDPDTALLLDALLADSLQDLLKVVQLTSTEVD